MKGVRCNHLIYILAVQMAAIKDFPSIYWREIGSSTPWFIFPCEGIRIAYFFSLPIYFPIVHSPDDV